MSRKTFVVISVVMALAMTLAAARDAERPLLVPASTQKAEQASELVGKLGLELAALHAEHREHLVAQLGRAAARAEFEPSAKALPVRGEHVLLDITVDGSPRELLQRLRDLGLQNGERLGRKISGLIPIDALDDLARLEGLKSARPSYAVTSVGASTSQGDAASRSDMARVTFGVDGTGVMVGALSDSYNCLGGAAAGVASGDIPPGLMVLDDSACAASDEGRALVEIVHDVAPGSPQAFHSAFVGDVGFATGIIELAAAGAEVIVDDAFLLNEPFFQDGVIAQAVDTVTADGVAYFSSAGNAARNSYESAFRPSGEFVISNGADAHDFDPGPGVDTRQAVTVPTGTTLLFALQWDEPFFSVSGDPGSASDVDICLLTALGGDLVGCGLFNNLGDDPLEVFQYTNDGTLGTTLFNIAIEVFDGPAPNVIKYIYFVQGGNDPTINQFPTNSGTVVGHANAAGAQAVGAAFYLETPEFNADPALLEPFSAAGGVEILFDTAGNRLAVPEDRAKPEIVAADGVNTTFFGFEIGDGGGPNFFGTSAAVPHAAGVAALIRQRQGAFSPQDIFDAMESTAANMGPPGFDNDSGFGFLFADDALGVVPECGDNTTQAPEECDDGNLAPGDGCDPDCLIECVIPSQPDLRFPDKNTATWGPDSATAFDVVRGHIDEFPVGSGPSEICLDPATTNLFFEDMATPGSGTAFYYQLRGRSACANGGYGFEVPPPPAPPVERMTNVCPD